MPIRNSPGFTLLELMIVVSIVSILAAIALPTYLATVTATRRAAAEGCLSSYANYMERFYATNLSYSQDTSGNAVTASTLSALNLDCASTQNTGQYYSYGFPANNPAAATFIVQAVPIGSQLSKDTLCGTLQIDQLGTRYDTGTASATPSSCWQH